MDLILWRHADAENGSPDAERRLTAKGRKQALRMAKWLGERLPKGTRVLCSPARRARQTARALTGDFEVAPGLDTGAGARDLLAACGWPASERPVLAVGHQPTLGEAAALALTGRPGAWSLKKGAVFWIESRGRGESAVRAVISPELL
jgi:phosphohistidine phosphatase